MARRVQARWLGALTAVLLAAAPMVIATAHAASAQVETCAAGGTGGDGGNGGSKADGGNGGQGGAGHGASCNQDASGGAQPAMDCSVGGGGGAGGSGGKSKGGDPGKAFNSPVGSSNAGGSASAKEGTAVNTPILSSGGGPGATANKGHGGDADGGNGARGGQGTWSDCNQSANGGLADSAGRAAASSARPPAFGTGGPNAGRTRAVAYGKGGPLSLAHTGASTPAELAGAGLALLIGGFLVLATLPRRRRSPVVL